MTRKTLTIGHFGAGSFNLRIQPFHRSPEIGWHMEKGEDFVPDEFLVFPLVGLAILWSLLEPGETFMVFA